MRRLPVLLLLALLTLLAGCGSNASTGDKGYVSGDGIVKEYHGADRVKVPTISGTTLTGAKVTVPGLAAGRPTVLNVWGSWCPSCRKEAPMLQAAATKLGDRASFLGVDVRDDSARDNALAYERTFGITYPSLFDPDGRSLLRLPRGVSLPAIPSTLVLDGQGRVSATIVGSVPSTITLVELVRDAEKK